MKKLKLFENFDSVNEEATYKDLQDDLESAFMETGIQEHTFDNEIPISASSWNIGHPNGSIGITFWLDEKVPSDILIKTAKAFAESNDLVAATFYPEGVEVNDKSAQDWNNKAGMKSEYVYGFTFYKPNYVTKSVYTELK